MSPELIVECGKNFYFAAYYLMVILWGGMNSWFLYEFLVLSMGSISANIMNNLGNFGYAMLVMVLGSGITVTRPMNTMGRSSVSLRASSIGLIVRCGVVCFFLLA